MYVDDIVITRSDSKGISSLKVLSLEPIPYKGLRDAKILLGD